MGQGGWQGVKWTGLAGGREGVTQKGESLGCERRVSIIAARNGTDETWRRANKNMASSCPAGIVLAPSAVSKLKWLASYQCMGKLWKVISPGKKAAAAAGPVATGGSTVAVASGSAAARPDRVLSCPLPRQRCASSRSRRPRWRVVRWLVEGRRDGCCGGEATRTGMLGQ